MTQAPPQFSQVAMLLVGFLALALAGMLALAGYRLRVPEAHVADTAKLVVAWIFGLVIMVGGGFVIVAAIAKFRILPAVIGLVAVMVGLTVVGITVGVPAALEPIVQISNTLIRVVNLVVTLLEKLIHP